MLPSDEVLPELNTKAEHIEFEAPEKNDETKKLEKEFKHSAKEKGDRRTSEHNSRMIEGDPYDYISINKSGYIEPIVDIRSFDNRIKVAPSVFSFIKVPQDVKVFDWPRPDNPWHTNRVLGGIAKQAIPTRKWDELNAVLGPKYKVNLILIGKFMILEYSSS